MTLLFAYYGMSSVGSYNEYVYQIEVKHRDELFDYYLLLILGNESAIFSGRKALQFCQCIRKALMYNPTGICLVNGSAERAG
jgi:acetoacetate decarboxylase